MLLQFDSTIEFTIHYVLIIIWYIFYAVNLFQLLFRVFPWPVWGQTDKTVTINITCLTCNIFHWHNLWHFAVVERVCILHFTVSNQCVWIPSRIKQKQEMDTADKGRRFHMKYVNVDVYLWTLGLIRNWNTFTGVCKILSNALSRYAWHGSMALLTTTLIRFRIKCKRASSVVSNWKPQSNST